MAVPGRHAPWGLFPTRAVAHLRAARAARLQRDRDIGPARTALRADGSFDELGDG